MKEGTANGKQNAASAETFLLKSQQRATGQLVIHIKRQHIECTYRGKYRGTYRGK